MLDRELGADASMVVTVRILVCPFLLPPPAGPRRTLTFFSFRILTRAGNVTYNGIKGFDSAVTYDDPDELERARVAHTCTLMHSSRRRK